MLILREFERLSSVKGNILKIKVRFFAVVRQLAGTDALNVEVSAGATIAFLCDHLGQQIPQLRSRLPSLLIALNGEFARSEVALKDGDEVALLPPFSGG